MDEKVLPKTKPGRWVAPQVQKAKARRAEEERKREAAREAEAKGDKSSREATCREVVRRITETRGKAEAKEGNEGKEIDIINNIFTNIFNDGETRIDINNDIYRIVNTNILLEITKKIILVLKGEESSDSESSNSEAFISNVNFFIQEIRNHFIQHGHIIQFVFKPEDMKFLIHILYLRLKHIKDSSHFLEKWLIIPHIFNVFPSFKRSASDKSGLFRQKSETEGEIKLSDEIKQEDLKPTDYIDVENDRLVKISQRREQKVSQERIYFKKEKRRPTLFNFLDRKAYINKLRKPLEFKEFSDKLPILDSKRKFDFYDFAKFDPDTRGPTYYKLISRMDLKVGNNIILKGNFVEHRIKEKLEDFKDLWRSMKSFLTGTRARVFCLTIKSKNSFSKVTEEKRIYPNKRDREPIYNEENDDNHTIKGYDDLFMLYQIKSKNLDSFFTTDTKLIYDSLIKDRSTNVLLDGNVYELTLKEVTLQEGELTISDLDDIVSHEFFKITTPEGDDIKGFTYNNYINMNASGCQELPRDAQGDLTKIKALQSGIRDFKICAQKLYGLSIKDGAERAQIIRRYHSRPSELKEINSTTEVVGPRAVGPATLYSQSSSLGQGNRRGSLSTNWRSRPQDKGKGRGDQSRNWRSRQRQQKEDKGRGSRSSNWRKKGGNWQKKYLKYKKKYIALKNKLLKRN